MSYRRVLGIFALVTLLMGTAAVVAQQRQQAPGLPPRPSWAKIPINAVEYPKDPGEKALRDARSFFWNDKSGMMPRLDAPPDAPPARVVINVTRVTAPSLPLTLSDTVVVATVKKAQPYFSADHTRIYTELQLLVHQILMDSKKSVQRELIDVAEEGGVLRTGGRVFESPVYRYCRHIDKEGRYLLFLHYRPSIKTFSLVKVWELGGGNPVPLEPVRPPSRYEAVQSKLMNMTEAQFIAYVQQAIPAGKDE